MSAIRTDTKVPAIEKEPQGRMRIWPPAIEVPPSMCCICLQPSAIRINKVSVCNSERCKYLAWTF